MISRPADCVAAADGEEEDDGFIVGDDHLSDDEGVKLSDDEGAGEPRCAAHTCN